jgi:hypothetical protein
VNETLTGRDVPPARPATATPADAARTAAILGGFALAWFGWGGAGASATLTLLIRIASGITLAVTLAAVYLAYRTRGAPSAVAGDPASGRRYGIVVGAEVVACAVGAYALGATGGAEWIPVWIAAVVGAHFFALVPALHDRWLVPLGVVMLLVAGAGLVVGLTTDTAPNTVVGAGAGLALGGYATAKLAVAAGGVRRRSGPPEAPEAPDAA